MKSKKDSVNIQKVLIYSLFAFLISLSLFANLSAASNITNTSIGYTGSAPSIFAFNMNLPSNVIGLIIAGVFFIVFLVMGELMMAGFISLIVNMLYLFNGGNVVISLVIMAFSIYLIFKDDKGGGN